MENGILKEINTQNIFASPDKRFIYVPIIIDQTKVFDDLNIVCHINKSRYTIKKSSPTKVLPNNKTYDITFSEIYSQFDTLSRKIFSKNISIRSGQKERATKFLIQQVENPSQRETIYLVIRKNLVDSVFKESNELDQEVQQYTHYFSVYITNKKTGQIIESIKTGDIEQNPYRYFEKNNPSVTFLNDITENFFNSISISLTPYVEGFGLPFTGFQFKYNQSMFNNISRLNPEFSLKIYNKEDNRGSFASSEGTQTRAFFEFNIIPLNILDEKALIQSIISSAVNSDDETIDIQVILTFDFIYNNKIENISYNKIFSLDKSKIINMARSFYSYHLNYYFGSANIFDRNSFGTVGNGTRIKVKPNKDIVENSIIYEIIKNGKIRFIDTSNGNNSIIRKIYFTKEIRSFLESRNGFFLVKDILNKNIKSFFIPADLRRSRILTQNLVINATIGTKNFRIYPNELPEAEEGALTNCDETEFARSLIDSCDEAEE